jgi:hypothetical protein
VVSLRASSPAHHGERRQWALRLDPRSGFDLGAAAALVEGFHGGSVRGRSGDVVLSVSRGGGGLALWKVEAHESLGRLIVSTVAAVSRNSELVEVSRDERPTGEPMRVAFDLVPPRKRLASAGPSGFGDRLVELLVLAHGVSAALVLRVRPGGEGGGSNMAAPRFKHVFLDSVLGRPSAHTQVRSGSSALPREAAPIGPRFVVEAYIEAHASDRRRAQAWCRDALALTSSLSAAGWQARASIGGKVRACSLSSTDVADLWGLVTAADETRPVDLVRSRSIAAPGTQAATGTRVIGESAGRPIHIESLHFMRHGVFVGMNGSGKSTQMVALAADDLAAGRGFTFLDPHGDAVARLLDAVPPDQQPRVHLLEIAERARPRSFNILELDGADPEAVAADFVDVLRDLNAGLTSGPKQWHILRMALMTILDRPEGPDGPWTIADLHRLLSNPDYRADFVARLTDPHLVEFWRYDWPDSRSASRDPSIEAIRSKLSTFLGYPSIREIVSTRRSTIRPRQIMDDGDVLLVDLSRVGLDRAQLFGAMLVTRFLIDARGRLETPLDQRRPHMLYIDEAQAIETSALRAIYQEGRKLRLGLGLATQALNSLSADLQSSIRTNAGTLFVMQPGPENIRALGASLAPLGERDLLSMPRFTMALRTEFGGMPTTVTARILPEVRSLGSAAAVREMSDRQDGHVSRAEGLLA